jgi:hypothetical protein
MPSITTIYPSVAPGVTPLETPVGRAEAAATAAEAALATTQALVATVPPVFSTIAEAAASPNLSDIVNVVASGFQFVYSASSISHVGGFFNAASGRWYQYADPVFWQEAIDDVGLANGSANNAATAAYALGIPLNLYSGRAVLTIDPNAEALSDTDTARHTVIQNAKNWIATCWLSGAGEIALSITGGTAIKVFGQIIWGDINAPSVRNPPLVINMGAPVSRNISAIAYGTPYSGVPFCSVTAGGTGYTGPFAVTLSSGDGGVIVGFAATAYVDAGVIVSIVVTSYGTITTPGTFTCDLSAGGGSGGAATPITNSGIVDVTIDLSTDRPANCAVGMPVGGQDISGDNDAGSINGSARIKSLPGTATQIVIETTSIRVDAPVSPTTLNTTAGLTATINFPQQWLEVRGGYTGSQSGREGYWNATAGNVIKFEFVHGCWSPDGQEQAAKTNQSFIHGGALGAGIHIANESIVANFPLYQVRLNGSWFYLNFLHAGGGVCGSGVVTLQGGGKGQIVQSSLGMARTQVLIAGRGVELEMSSTDIGAGTEGIGNEGGYVSYSTCRIHGCNTGVNTDHGGRSYGAATALINRCRVGVDHQNGGRNEVAAASITNSIVSQCPYPVNAEAEGGWWREPNDTTVTRRYWTTTVFDGVGAGTPEGAVTAGIGSTWRRTDGGAGTSFYVKESGTGNTGWVGK